MQLEELYHRKLENVSDTAELRMHAVMMVAEQKQTYTFAVTERQQGEQKGFSLWQYRNDGNRMEPIGKGQQQLAIRWLEQFARVFEEARYRQVYLPVLENGQDGNAEEGAEQLLCEGQAIKTAGAAILYMGQDIFGMSCHAHTESGFGGLHYNDVFELRICNAHIRAEMLGICLDQTRIDEWNYLAYCPEVSYRLKHKNMKYLTVTELRQPFQLIEFIIRSADPDAQVEIAEYETQKVGRHFLGVRKICNLSLGEEEEFYIGDVTVTRGIHLQGKPPEEFALADTVGAYLWVKVTAETLYQAYEKIREELECAAGILNLLIKNDSVLPFYWKKQELPEWRYRFHEAIVYTGDGIYLENCDTAESFYYGGQNEKHSGVYLEKAVREYLADDNALDAMINLFTDQRKHEAFFLMLRWFTAGCAAETLEEKVIYLDMALEFAMSGERGISFLEARGMEETAQREMLETLAGSIQGLALSKEVQEELQRQITNTLTKNTSFISKLERFIKEEQLLVSASEIELIQKMRKKRNAIAHGKRNVTFSRREAEKVTGIISNLLLAKVYKVVGKDECH